MVDKNKAFLVCPVAAEEDIPAGMGIHIGLDDENRMVATADRPEYRLPRLIGHFLWATRDYKAGDTISVHYYPILGDVRDI